MSGGPRVRVHWMPVGPVPPATVALLDEDSRQQAAAITHPAARQRFLAGRVLTLTALATTLGVAPRDVPAVVRRCEHCRGPHGRPRIPGSGVSFSLTRSGDLVAVATVRNGGGVVGLDLERRSAARSARPVPDDVLAPGEHADTGRAQDDDPSLLLRTWTRKEALLKATGRGLVVPMHAVHVSSSGSMHWGTVSRQFDPRGADPVAIVDVDLPGHVGAVAVPGATSIRCAVVPSGALTASEEEVHGGLEPSGVRGLPPATAPTTHQL